MAFPVFHRTFHRTLPAGVVALLLTSFAVAEDADFLIGVAALESVDGGEDLLDFVADEVAAHVEGLAVEEFAAGLVGALPFS